MVVVVVVVVFLGARQSVFNDAVDVYQSTELCQVQHDHRGGNQQLGKYPAYIPLEKDLHTISNTLVKTCIQFLQL